MIRKRALIGILVALVLVGAVPVSSLAAPDLARSLQTGQNLLKNPGFEGITCSPRLATRLVQRQLDPGYFQWAGLPGDLYSSRMGHLLE